MYREYLAPVEGSPGVVASSADTYLHTATLIREAADQLLLLIDSDETIAHSVDAVRSAARSVHDDIVDAHHRYDVSAHALKEYAPKLQHAQSAVDEVITNYHKWAEQAEQAQQDVLYSPHSADPGEHHQLLEQYHQASSRRSDALVEYRAEVRALQLAADETASRIKASFKNSDLNDGFWDNVKGFFDGLADWFENLMKAVLDAIGPIIESLMQALTLLASGLALLLLLGGLAVALLNNPLFLLAFIAAALIDDRFLADTVSALMVVGLTPSIVTAIVTGHGDPRVRLLSTSKAPADRDPSKDYAGVWQTQGVIDNAGEKAIGGAGSGVVEVREVVDERGVTRWRVQIPSTQQWLAMFGDAPNDLDGNLWSKLNASERSQLEKSVQDALKQSGYVPGSGEEIMLAGFSQGGIAAANLAADPKFREAYNVTSVYTSGAPIADVPIPNDVRVLSIEHRGDIVPELDFFNSNPERPNWHTIYADSQGAQGPASHNSVDYSTTASTYVDGSKADAQTQRFKDETSGFFSNDETVSRYDVKRGHWWQ